MGLSCLTNSMTQLVFDASTAINLNGTGRAAEILRALRQEVVITDAALGELTEDSQSRRKDGEMVEKLIGTGLIRIEHIANLTQPIFENLVIGHGPDTLDDGEAATIAYAVESGAVAVLDERKARRICTGRFATTKVASTVDLLCHPAVAASLGPIALAEAVFSALQQARMRVLPHHEQWVVDIIGAERARECPSLPRRSRINVQEMAKLK